MESARVADQSRGIPEESVAGLTAAGAAVRREFRLRRHVIEHHAADVHVPGEREFAAVYGRTDSRGDCARGSGDSKTGTAERRFAQPDRAGCKDGAAEPAIGAERSAGGEPGRAAFERRGGSGARPLQSGIGKCGEGAAGHGGRTGAGGNSEGAGESEDQAPALHRRGGRAGGDQRLVLVFPQPGNHGRRASGRAHHADGVEGLRARGGSFGGRQPAGESRASAGEDRPARLPGGSGSGQGCTGTGGKRSAVGRRGRAADAGLAKAQATYDQAQTADLAWAQANVEKSRANAELAKADLARYTPLMEKGEISKQQYDAAKANADATASALKADQEKLAQARHNVDVAKAQLDAAKARVEQARAGVASAHADVKQVSIKAADAQAKLAKVEQARGALDAAQLNLSYTEITAPVDGVATHKQVEPGQIVQAGQGLLVVVPLQSVWVTANFKETQLKNMKPGQKAEVKVDTYGKTFSGRVDSIAGATGSVLSLLPPENATGNYVKVVQRIPVKIVLDPIPSEKAVLRPGMNVDATVITN